MSNITASMVKELRNSTGAGMMDAKKALVENNGDIDAAVDWLRTKGLAKAAKKSGRTAAEGLVAVATSGNKGAVVEINSETDFVSRNAEFQGFVSQVAELAIGTQSTEELASKDFGNGKSVQEELTDLIARIGENMTLRRSETLEVENGVVSAYVHGALADGLGKIGVLVAMETSANDAKVEATGKQVAMHIAAANPQSLNSASLDPALVEREKAVLTEQAIASGKPAEIAEKMVVGRMSKFYSEVCLTEQTFVIDGETKVGDVVANLGKDIGSDVELAKFARIQLGEGIEKEEEDFAAEVSKVANG